MKVHYKNNLKQAFLIIEGEDNIEEDFQVFMLQENEIPGLLNTSIKCIDNQSHFYYDISGKVSLATMSERRKLSGEDIRHIVHALLRTVKEMQKYMLDDAGILLEPEYIYGEGSTYFFCFYPRGGGKLREEFHRLTEFFVREVDYKDKQGVHLAYILHKSTMEENYSIEKIMDEVVREEIIEVRYEERMEESIKEDMTEQGLIEEEQEFWEPVKKLLDKKKRGKWGYWDEIHIEETDL